MTPSTLGRMSSILELVGVQVQAIDAEVRIGIEPRERRITKRRAVEVAIADVVPIDVRERVQRVLVLHTTRAQVRANEVAAERIALRDVHDGWRAR